MGKRSTFVNPTGWKRLKRKRNAWVSSQASFIYIIAKWEWAGLRAYRSTKR